MITSFLNAVNLSLSGTGIAYESGATGSSVLYDLPTTDLNNTYTVLTITAGSDTDVIRIDKAYSGKTLGIINVDRQSFLFTYTSGAGGTGSVTATANYYDNVGPRQRALVQGYEA